MWFSQFPFFPLFWQSVSFDSHLWFRIEVPPPPQPRSWFGRPHSARSGCVLTPVLCLHSSSSFFLLTCCPRSYLKLSRKYVDSAPFSLRPSLCGISGGSLSFMTVTLKFSPTVPHFHPPITTTTTTSMHTIMLPHAPHITLSLQGLLITKDGWVCRFIVQLFRLQLFSIHASDWLVKLGQITTHRVRNIQ